MPCEPIIKKGKMIGWLCIRSRGRVKPPPCYKCGASATRLCDHRDCGTYDGIDDCGRKVVIHWASINTCDRPMCDACANKAGADLDYCDEHNNQFSQEKSARADRIYREQLRRLGMEE